MKEAENNWQQFVGKLDNSDMTDQIVKIFAQGFVSSVNYVKSLTKDDMKMAIANTFLISQGHSN